MRIVFAGTPAVAVPSLRALLGSEHEVVAVLSQPPARSGRGRTLTPSPVAQVALDEGIEVLTPTTLRAGRDDDADAAIARLSALAPEAIAVVAYGQLVPRDLLDLPTHGWINLHFSLLPAWRGAAPVQAALLAGDEFTGASTFLIEAGLDTGPVFGILTERIRPDDTSTVLLDRLADAGAPLLVATFDGLASGDISAVAQLPEGVSHAAKITVADAEVRFALPGVAIDRHIRAMTDAPGAWTTLGEQRIKLGPVALAAPEDGAQLASGELLVTKREVFVGTGSEPVRLGLVQPPGKKPMPAADWARGNRIDSGARFVTTNPEANNA